MPAKSLAIGLGFCAPRLGEGERFVKILTHVPAGPRSKLLADEIASARPDLLGL
jgi:hypothetical protein